MMAQSGIVLKQKAVEAIDLEARITQLCEESPKGVTNAAIVADQPSVDAARRVTAINRLLSAVY